MKLASDTARRMGYHASEAAAAAGGERERGEWRAVAKAAAGALLAHAVARGSADNITAVVGGAPWPDNDGTEPASSADAASSAPAKSEG